MRFLHQWKQSWNLWYSPRGNCTKPLRGKVAGNHARYANQSLSRSRASARAPIRCSGCTNALGIRSSREAEGACVLRRVKEIGRVILVEHLVDLADNGLEPTEHLDHGPREKTPFCRPAHGLGCCGDEFPAGERVRRRGQMP